MVVKLGLYCVSHVVFSLVKCEASISSDLLLTIVHNKYVNEIYFSQRPFSPTLLEKSPVAFESPPNSICVGSSSGLDKCTAVAVSTAVVLKHSDRHVINEGEPFPPFPASFLR